MGRGQYFDFVSFSVSTDETRRRKKVASSRVCASTSVGHNDMWDLKVGRACYFKIEEKHHAFSLRKKKQAQRSLKKKSVTNSECSNWI